MKTKHSLTLSALLLLASPTLASSYQTEADSLQSRQLDELVVQASRQLVPLKRLPSKVELISAESIERGGYTNLANLLKNLSSVDVVQYPGFNASVGMRGFKPGKGYNTILINGLPAATDNISTIGLEAVERIEILKGPFSSIYGSSAMGGVINVVTKESRGDLEGGLSLSMGSFSTGNANIRLGGGISGGLSFDFTASYNSQASDYKVGRHNILSLSPAEEAILDPNTRGKQMPSSHYGVLSSSLRLGYVFSPSWHLNIYENLFVGKPISLSDNVWGTYGVQQKDLVRSQTAVEVVGQLGSLHRLSFKPYWSVERYDAYNALGRDAYINYKSKSLDYGAQLQDQMKLGNLSLTLGADYKASLSRTKRFDEDGTQIVRYNPDYSTNDLGLFAQGQLSLLDERLSLTAGLRLDLLKAHIERDELLKQQDADSKSYQVLSPNFGIKYELLKGLNLHATIGQAFLAPDAIRKTGYYESWGGYTIGNRDLEPERSTTYDLGLGYSNLEQGLELDITYFHSDHRGMIVPTQLPKANASDPTIRSFINSNKAKRSGLEIILSYDLGSLSGYRYSLRPWVNATWLFNSKVLLSSGDGSWDEFRYVRKQNMSFGIDFQRQKLSLSLNGRYLGQRWEDDWNSAVRPNAQSLMLQEVPGAKGLRHPAALIFGASAHYDLTNKLRLGFNAYNLLDEHYTEKDGYPMAGRSFLFSASYRL